MREDCGCNTCVAPMHVFALWCCEKTVVDGYARWSSGAFCEKNGGTMREGLNRMLTVELNP